MQASLGVAACCALHGLVHKAWCAHAAGEPQSPVTPACSRTWAIADRAGGREALC